MDPEDIKTLVRAYFHRLINKKDLSVCDVVLSPHYIDHDVPPDTTPGPDETNRFTRQFLEYYPNLKVQVKEVVAGDNKAAAQIIWTGKHRDTKQKLRRMGNIIIHLDDNGQFLERWSVYQDIET